MHPARAREYRHMRFHIIFWHITSSSLHLRYRKSCSNCAPCSTLVRIHHAHPPHFMLQATVWSNTDVPHVGTTCRSDKDA